MPNLFLKVDKDLFNLGLNPTEILLLAQVIEFNTNSKECFMTDAQFAANFGVSPKTISRALDRLEKEGFIIRETKTIASKRIRPIKILQGRQSLTNIVNTSFLFIAFLVISQSFLWGMRSQQFGFYAFVSVQRPFFGPSSAKISGRNTSRISSAPAAMATYIPGGF